MNPSISEISVERVDDIPILYGLLTQMRVQKILDEVIIPHGNWKGLSPGWVITIWLIHILSEQNHCMEAVEAWTDKHLRTLGSLTGEKINKLDLSDDRLGICLKMLHDVCIWGRVEQLLGATILRVYKLKAKILRLDATVGTVGHDPLAHTLFKIGKSKSGSYETQFKMMLASLDPLGLPVVVDIVAGNTGDDPLYVPSYRRAKSVLKFANPDEKEVEALLVVGDSKMSAIKTRKTIAKEGDHYLTPLAWLKDDPNLLTQLLHDWQQKGEIRTNIWLPKDIPTDGQMPTLDLAIAYGFEVDRSLEHKGFNWTERLLVVRSHNYTQSMQQGLHRRLDKAESGLNNLTPAKSRGKKQIKDEKILLDAIAKLEKQYGVKGLFDYHYECQSEPKHVRAYKDRPARTELNVRYQLTVTRNLQAISEVELKAGWRIYGTNAPTTEISLTQAVLSYRDQYIAENIFRRLQGKYLSITPLYLQREDHAQGLLHLLTIGARVLALGDYQAKKALVEENDALDGIYKGSKTRSTKTPTTERMLKAFEHINLLITSSVCSITPLSPVQERILTLLGLPKSLYTSLAKDLQRENQRNQLEQEHHLNNTDKAVGSKKCSEQL